MSCEDHAAGSVGESAVGVCGNVVEQLVNGGGCVFGGRGLLGSDFTEGDDELVVDGSSIEEEGANNALDLFDAVIVEGWTSWISVGILDLCAVDDFGVLVGGHDAFDGHSVASFGKNGDNIFIHCEMASMLHIVPGRVDTGVERTVPVLGDGVVLEESIAQVVGMMVANVFDAKIVNSDGEHDGAPLVSP